MYSFSAWNVLLCMILYQQNAVVYMQSLTLSLETSPLKCGDVVKLKCVYSGATCCTDARLWTLNGTQIMNNGAATDNTKHREERNDAGFNFNIEILNLEESDFGKPFQCHYNFKSSNEITLVIDNKYECVQPTPCPISYKKHRDNEMIVIEGTLNISKAAPKPLIEAFYGDDNLTADFSNIVEPTNYETWYYNLSKKIDKPFDCYYHAGDKFYLFALTGTSRKQICEKDMCECPKCGLHSWLISLILPVLGNLIFVVYSIYCCCSQFGEGSACSGRCAILALMLLSFTCLLSTILTLPIGIIVCPCNEGWYQFLNICWGFLTCHITILWIDLSFMAFDWKYLKENHKTVYVAGILLGNIPILILSIHDGKSYKGLCGCSWKLFLRSVGFGMLMLFIIPIPFIFIYFYCLKDKNHTTDGERAMDGGNNRSKESGSSCWPPCSVGPDPNSPDPENARSLLKKNADKKNEKKPVAVVRSQPPKNRHVKTDNTESTRYSAETEIFDEGVHKSAKSRPLPSIGQPTISPRPLPQMPPSSQLEKGGIQLEPLGDSTSEKKKKKRRKKKESKQSGDED